MDNISNSLLVAEKLLEGEKKRGVPEDMPYAEDDW